MGRTAWLAALGLWALPALAVELQFGPVSGALNTRVVAGAAMRVEGRDFRMIAKLANPGQLGLCDAHDCQSQNGDPAPNQQLVDARGAFSGVNEDNGNLNYGAGDLSAAVFQLRPKLELVWDDWQFQASGLLFYDVVNAGFDERHRDTRYQPARTPRADRVESLFADGQRLGNLFVSRSFDIDGRELLVRVGNQVLNWGEANLVQFNTLSEWAPLDAPMLALPGSEPSQLQWRAAKLPASGSLLSFSDVAGGGEYAILGFGNFHEDPDRQFRPAGLAATISESTRTVYLPNEDFGAPRDGPDKYDWRAPALHEHEWRRRVRSTPLAGRLSVLNVSHVDARADGHVGSAMAAHSDAKKARAAKDCLHYCYPGPSDSWAVALYNLLLNNPRYAAAP